MARQKGLLKEEFVNKKGEEDVPVDPCKGWIDACEFCDKRFGNWVESSDEVLEKIPSKPGIFMIALKNKTATEVQNIVLDDSDVQKSAYKSVDSVKERIADKKSKATKSTILCRWMNFKTKNEKDVVSLCAHWYNNGILPKDMSSWPGMDLVEQSDNFKFSTKLQKWCYPRKDAVWRKTKSTYTKKVEVVAECDFEEPCEICDSSFGFSEWKPFPDVIHDNLGPDANGIYQVSVKYGRKREVVYIGYDSGKIKLNLRLAFRGGLKWIESALRNEKFKNKNASLEIRWLELGNIDSENSCFLYAHWLNAGRFPILNHQLPGERQLEKHKSFVLRVNDKRWCYEIDVFKQSRLSKFKSRKQLLDDLQEEYKYLHCSDD